MESSPKPSQKEAGGSEDAFRMAFLRLVDFSRDVSRTSGESLTGLTRLGVAGLVLVSVRGWGAGGHPLLRLCDSSLDSSHIY